MWFHPYVGCETETHGHRQQCGGYQREGEGGSRGDRGVVIYDDRKWFDIG